MVVGWGEDTTYACEVWQSYLAYTRSETSILTFAKNYENNPSSVYCSWLAVEILPLKGEKWKQINIC